MESPNISKQGKMTSLDPDNNGIEDTLIYSRENSENELKGPQDQHKHEKQEIPEVIQLNLMDCVSCTRKCYPPVYFCSNGHILCYACAALFEVCTGTPHCSSKIYLKKLKAFDELHEYDEVNCIRSHLGCQQKLPAKEIVQHAQYACLFRLSITCLVNECAAKNPNVYWGLIDDHMEKCHQSEITRLDSTCCGKSYKMWYSDAQEGIFLMPTVFDKDNIRKFIPAFKKESGRIYLWVYMLEDGYIHEDPQFQTTLILRTIYKPYYMRQGKVAPGWRVNSVLSSSKCIEMDVMEFEKRCIFFDAKNNNPYFMMDFAIKELMKTSPVNKPHHMPRIGMRNDSVHSEGKKSLNIIRKKSHTSNSYQKGIGDSPEDTWIWS